MPLKGVSSLFWSVLCKTAGNDMNGFCLRLFITLALLFSILGFIL